MTTYAHHIRAIILCESVRLLPESRLQVVCMSACFLHIMLGDQR